MRKRFNQMPKREVEGLDHVLVRTQGHGGYWGRGKTIAEAVKAAKWIGSQDPVYVCQVDAKGRCDEVSGDLQYDQRGPIYTGKVMSKLDDVMVDGVYQENYKTANE